MVEQAIIEPAVDIGCRFVAPLIDTRVSQRTHTHNDGQLIVGKCVSEKGKEHKRLPFCTTYVQTPLTAGNGAD